jgi:hypothetical protein
MAVAWCLSAAQEPFSKLRAARPEQFPAHGDVGHVGPREKAARLSKALKSLIAFVRCRMSKAHCNMCMYKQGVGQASFDKVSTRRLGLITGEVVTADSVPGHGGLGTDFR